MPELNEKVVKELPAPAVGNKVYFFTGATLQGITAPAGFGVCVTANDSRSFILPESLLRPSKRRGFHHRLRYAGADCLHSWPSAVGAHPPRPELARDTVG
jgi:hypothetical protein